jgi:glycosyltransferase involved in cell wall biosynthesis
MPSGRSIICFSSNDWSDIPSSKFHIMRYLGKRYTVLYVETIGIRQPKLVGRDFKRIFQKLKMSLRGLNNVESNIYTWSPMAIPFHKFKFVRWLNAFLIARMVKYLSCKLNLQNPIIWSYLPNTVEIIKQLPDFPLIYHCIDDYGEFTDAPKNTFALMEQQMLRLSDLTVVSAKRLLSSRRLHSKNIIYIPHGVNLEEFQDQLNNKIELPDIDSLSRPIAGFIGRIADWINLELIVQCARELRDWNFVLVGPSNVDLTPYLNIKNIRFLGRKNHVLVPNYIQRFDVCLMPFAENNLVASVNPLKMYEYLAVGKPVVSVPMPEVEEFSSVISIAKQTDFSAAIVKAYREDTPQKQESRIESISGRSWHSIANEILESLDCSSV